MVYEKLVRDRIPAIMESKEQRPCIRILSDEEYMVALERKLDEETEEFHRDKNLEELADILEEVYTLTEALGSSREELIDVYQKKHNSRGGFRDRVYLISNEG